MQTAPVRFGDAPDDQLRRRSGAGRGICFQIGYNSLDDLAEGNALVRAMTGDQLMITIEDPSYKNGAIRRSGLPLMTGGVQPVARPCRFRVDG